MGFSDKERAILQDMGMTGVGQDAWYVWRHRVKSKYPQVLLDSLIALRQYREVDIDDYVLEDMLAYVKEIHKAAGEIIDRAAREGRVAKSVPVVRLRKTKP